jgi:ATP-binding cassette, subfamily B, bacterial
MSQEPTRGAAGRRQLEDFLGVFEYVKPSKPAYFLILCCDCLVEISFYLLTPIVMKLMIDAAVASDMALLYRGLYLTLAVSVSGMLLFVTIEFFLFGSFEKTSAHIKSRLFKTMLGLPISYVERTHSGDVISRLTNDAGAMENAYSWPLRMMLVTLLSGSGSAILMLALDWRVGLALIGMGLLSVLVNARQKRALRETSETMQKNLGAYTEKLSNALGGFMTMKSLGLEESMLESASRTNAEICEGALAIAKKGAIADSRNFFFSSLNFLGVVILASYLAMSGLGSLGSVLSMVLLLGNVNRMFGDINGMVQRLQGFLAGTRRVVDLIEQPLEPERVAVGASEGDSDAAIDMRDIVFSYDGRAAALDGISLTIRRGQRAALAGPSGGGKSTIAKLLMGFYAPASGSLSVEGRAIGSLSLAELRSMIAYVPQDSYVFSGSVAENIGYGRIGAGREEIAAAARAAHADEFIEALAEGYDTLVGERGVKLSGGQRQRIAIARAFLKNAPILLLDEATSSLDSQSEERVQDALDVLMKGRTTLIIAHRLSTIEGADLIFLVDRGKIVERGSHDELMSNGSLYPRLRSLQFRSG